MRELYWEYKGGSEGGANIRSEREGVCEGGSKLYREYGGDFPSFDSLRS